MKRALAILALATAFAAPLPAWAAAYTLKANVHVQADVVTLGDLVKGVSGDDLSRALFRAPRPGDIGTIQTSRILDAVRQLGLTDIDTQGANEIVVTRDARRIGAEEISALIGASLQKRFGLDAASTNVVLDGHAPALFVDPRIKADLSLDDFSYDPRTHRFSAAISLPGVTAGRDAWHVSGAAIETVEVATLNRSLSRGDIVSATDITFERQARERVTGDIIKDRKDIVGRVATRSLNAGMVLRYDDVAKPEIIGRGDMVSVVYRAPGIVLTLRGKALQSGARDETITVMNLQSKRRLQGTVTAPGEVTVFGGIPGPMAANVAPAQVAQ